MLDRTDTDKLQTFTDDLWGAGGDVLIMPSGKAREHAADFDVRLGCSGVDLGSYHGGYFKNPATAALLSDIYLSHLQKKRITPEEQVDPIRILGMGSGAALVEVILYRALKEAGYDIDLTMTDISENALSEYYPGYGIGEDNPSVRKKVCDNKDLPFSDNTFDLVVARATVHYEKTMEARKQVLEKVKSVLIPGGLFLNQEHAIPSPEEALLHDGQRALGGRVSQHITAADVLESHEEVFGEDAVRLARLQPPALMTGDEDWAKKFKMNAQKQQELIYFVRGAIETHASIGNIRFSDDGKHFTQGLPFQIIQSQKTQA